jgi:hypothetical protein
LPFNFIYITFKTPSKQRLIEISWACGGALVLKVVLLARNRVISSVSTLVEIREN